LTRKIQRQSIVARNPPTSGPTVAPTAVAALTIPNSAPRRPLGDGLAQEAEPIRDERGRRDRLIDAEHGQQQDRVRRRGTGGRESEIDERGEHDVAAAEPVPHPSGDRLKRGHRDEVRSDDPARLRDVHLEVARDLRQGDHDHRRVQRHQQIAERDRDRDPPSVPFNLATRGRGP